MKNQKKYTFILNVQTIEDLRKIATKKERSLNYIISLILDKYAKTHSKQ